MRIERVAVLAALAFLVTACGSSGNAGPSSSNSDESPSGSPTASSCTTSRLTGLCTDAMRPVLIVKVDDVREARPQFNLNAADVILVEPVEGGLTRIMAVYQSQQPNYVGPVRSARITDTDLVSAFGKPGFAYSGSARKLVPYLKAASMQMVGAPQGGRGYSRLSDRPAPHNYLGEFATLIDRIDDPVAAQLKVGAVWTFGADNHGGAPSAGFEVKWPAAEKSFSWDTATKSWAEKVYGNRLLTQLDLNGTTEPVNATNVVVMESQLQDSEFGDKLGHKTPYPQTIGQGRGLVFSNGRAYQAQWRRPMAADLPRWFAADGSEIELAPGNVWWLIVTDLSKVSLTLPR